MTVSLTTTSGDGVVQQQAKRLRRSRALATGLLALAGFSFAATLMIRNPGPALLLLRAVAEAALVGGLAVVSKNVVHLIRHRPLLERG